MQISPQGLMRLSIDELLSCPVVHLCSGVDGDFAASPEHCGQKSTLCGYTEWTSANDPVISIGWDWCIQSSPLGVFWVRVGSPSSNLMLVDHRGVDFGWQRSQNILASVLDALPWKEQVPAALAIRYAP